MRKWTILVMLVFCTSLMAMSETLSICSFNIKWLGYSSTRDCATLARFLSNFDVVVIQETVAPPYDNTFPNGESFRPDPEVTLFFEEMIQVHKFEYLLSVADSGSSKTNDNSPSTEWFAAFYDPRKLEPAEYLPTAFIDEPIVANEVYDRVPHAFSLRHLLTGFDFVMISVHLHTGHTRADVQTRSQELAAISTWVSERENGETHYVILGDMNFRDCEELLAGIPPGFIFPDPQINGACIDTSTSPNQEHPYDFAFHTNAVQMDPIVGLCVIDLVASLSAIWNPLGEPINQAYAEYGFVDVFSDHNPIAFRIEVPLGDSD